MAITVKIVTPKAGETVRGIVRVVAETDLPVAFAVDGKPRATDRTASSAFWWHTERFPDGAHQLSATVQGDGGSAATATVDVTIDNARTPAPEPPAPVGPRPETIWDEDGIFVNDPSAFSAQLHGEWAWAAGFRWVAPRIQDGVTSTNEGELRGSRVLELLRTRGFKIVGWHVCRENPDAEVPTLARQVVELGLDGIIANAEYEYEFSADGAGGQAARPERFGRSRRFLTAFRALLPTTPVALSTFGRADHHDLDWSSWIRDGAHFLPQAYPNVSATLEVEPCVASAESCLSSELSWTRDRAHPTVNMTGEGSGPVAPAKYAKDLADAGVRGFSVYLGEVMDEVAYRAFGNVGSREELS